MSKEMRSDLLPAFKTGSRVCVGSFCLKVLSFRVYSRQVPSLVAGVHSFFAACMEDFVQM